VARRNALGKLKDTAIETLRGPVATAERVVAKAVVQARESVVVGRLVAQQVTKSVTARAGRTGARRGTPTARPVVPAPRTSAAAPAAPKQTAAPGVTPADIAKVVAKKAPARKSAAKKAPANKTTAKKAPSSTKSAPGAKLPPRKATPPPAPTPLIPRTSDADKR
jgi:nucleoid-associated protein YgaU